MSPWKCVRTPQECALLWMHFCGTHEFVFQLEHQTASLICVMRICGLIENTVMFMWICCHAGSVLRLGLGQGMLMSVEMMSLRKRVTDGWGTARHLTQWDGMSRDEMTFDTLVLLAWLQRTNTAQIRCSCYLTVPILLLLAHTAMVCRCQQRPKGCCDADWHIRWIEHPLFRWTGGFPNGSRCWKLNHVKNAGPVGFVESKQLKTSATQNRMRTGKLSRRKSLSWCGYQDVKTEASKVLWCTSCNVTKNLYGRACE